MVPMVQYITAVGDDLIRSVIAFTKHNNHKYNIIPVSVDIYFVVFRHIKKTYY